MGGVVVCVGYVERVVFGMRREEGVKDGRSLVRFCCVTFIDRSVVVAIGTLIKESWQMKRRRDSSMEYNLASIPSCWLKA